MKKKERIYLKEVDSFQQHMNKMINKCNDAIKEYSEDNNKWQEVSKCKSPYNLNLKLNKLQKTETKLKSEIEEWRKISGCNSPYHLGLKLNRINNVSAKKELQKQLMEQQVNIFNTYCNWVKENNLFDILETQIIKFDVFQYEKELAIELIATDNISSEDNHWFIIDFLYFLVANNIDDPDIRISKIDNKILSLNVDFDDFDVYDRDNKWYNEHGVNIKINGERNL